MSGRRRRRRVGGRSVSRKLRFAEVYVETVTSIDFGGAGRVSESSAWVSAWAARLVPVAERERYQGEFGSELYDLASSGAPARAQFACALRILLRAPLLRRELRKPQRESAR